MIERVIENWLGKVGERAFLRPFSHMMASEGHTIIHLTRHCAMELGKDLITIDPTGVPCAFQLKDAPNGRVSLSQFREKMQHQLLDLVGTPISHPSLAGKPYHKSFLVINGQLEEEAQAALDGMINGWHQSGFPHYNLTTIVRGELFQKAKALGNGLWPDQLEDIREILSLYLEDGRKMLPKDRFAAILEKFFLLDRAVNEPPSQNDMKRLLSSGGLLTGLCLGGFSEQKNYVSELEGWVIYACMILAVAERFNLPESTWEPEFEIALDSIYLTLVSLCEELKEATNLIGSNPPADVAVYRARITLLVGLMSIFGMWRLKSNPLRNFDNMDDFIWEFHQKHSKRMYLWGEGAVPLFLSTYWYWRNKSGAFTPELFILALLNRIVKSNGISADQPMCNPYYDVETAILHSNNLMQPKLEDSFSQRSFCLESLIHLVVRLNWKQHLRLLWTDISYITQCTFDPEDKFAWFRWRSNENGRVLMKMPQSPTIWARLKTEANEDESHKIPAALLKHPIFAAFFLIVYPHRLSPCITRYLDKTLY